jgi:hypothetical protein
LRKLQHRVFVIDLLGALDIRTDELEIAPHRFEDARFVSHGISLVLG